MGESYFSKAANLQILQSVKNVALIITCVIRIHNSKDQINQERHSCMKAICTSPNAAIVVSIGLLVNLEKWTLYFSALPGTLNYQGVVTGMH